MSENVESNEGRELARRAARQWLDENELVPLVLIAAEVDEPIELVADRLVDHVRLDDIGMRAVPAEVVRQFITERAEQTARMEEQSRRLQEPHKPSPVGRGVPALSDEASAFESLMNGDRSYMSPAEEFGQRPNRTSSSRRSRQDSGSNSRSEPRSRSGRRRDDHAVG